jgi:hypothetical protein
MWFGREMQIAAMTRTWQNENKNWALGSLRGSPAGLLQLVPWPILIHC